MIFVKKILTLWREPVWSLKIIVACLVLCRIVMLFTFPVSDPSEARYSVISKNMAETGDYVIPQLIHDGIMQSFDGKPPLYFQAAGFFCEIFGMNSFSVRLPSLLSALAILIMIYIAVRQQHQERTALYAVAICIFSVYFYVMSGIAITDMMLALSITGAILSYALFSNASERKTQKGWSILFFAFLGMGMITKGPVAIALSGMPIFLYTLLNRRWSDLRRHAWFLGTVVFLAIALPWYIMAAKANPGFLEYFFVNENFKRFLFEEYGDRYGSGRTTFRGMALVWFFVVNLPGLLLLLFPLVNRRWEIVRKSDFSIPVNALAILGCLSMTAFWCLTSRVPISYLLPTVPLCATFVAIKLQGMELLSNRNFAILFRRGLVIFACIIVLGISLVGAVTPIFSPGMPQRFYQRLTETLESKNLQSPSVLYFAGRTPYSVDFFLPREMVKNHSKEKVLESLNNSAPYYLVISERFWQRLDVPINRKLIFEYHKWRVYAPEGVK